MLFYILIIVSLLSGALICGGAGLFSTVHWLWVLPVSALAVLLLLAALIFLLLLIMARAVDQEQPQEADSPFYRFVIDLIVGAAIPVMGLRMEVSGLEKTPSSGHFLLVCNHLNEMDPVVLLRYFRKSQLAFISKEENRDMFLVGALMHKIQAQLIDRNNDRKALRTILSCVELLRQDKASVAVFPEGYIKPDKKLHHFRSGVFKIAQKAKVPVVVCTLRNTQYIFHNAKRLKKTPVALHLVDVVYPEQYAGMTTVELGNLIYEKMAQDLGPENVSADADQ